jgi:restriction endonuclease EcoRV
VYQRVAAKKSGENHTYTLEKLKEIPLPYKDVRIFVREKWRIASDRAGSGNTTNIGSINARLEDFEKGAGPFSSEEEYHEYWRTYGRTADDRKDSFKNIAEFRASRRKR